MAKMYPERLPPAVRANPRLSAEVKVFDALDRDAPEDVLVFYDVAWQAHARFGGVRDGQADFVLLHPARGLCVLEVKGGVVSRREDDTWTSRDRHGELHEITHPIRQAQRNVKNLVEKLREAPGWHRRPINHAHAVMFPDCEMPPRLQDSDILPEMCLDMGHLSSMRHAVLRMFDSIDGGRTGSLGPDGADCLRRLFAPTWQARRRIVDDVNEAEEEILRLGEEQVNALRLLGKVRRAAVVGCAGSGKTLLAVEKARCLAAEGFRTALLCFNSPLGEYLRTQTDGDGLQFAGTFHSQCLDRAQAGGSDFGDKLGAADDDFWNRELPELALDAGGPAFDAIVVDEGQDFRAEHWIVIQSWLETAESGILYVFSDDNQALYDARRPAGPSDLVPITLTQNWRNTRPIHELAVRFYRGAASPEPKGPPGLPVEFVSVGRVPLHKALRTVLHRLVQEEGVKPSAIVVLTPRTVAKTSVPPGTVMGNLVLTADHRPGPGCITVSSIHRFKGLERPVVVLAEVHDLHVGDRVETMYVGCTRARAHLVVLDEATSFEACCSV